MVGFTTTATRDPQQGHFPFRSPDSSDRLDTAYVRWWRDRSAYLTCGGLPQWLRAAYQYNRGVFGNLVVLSLPIILLALAVSLLYTPLRRNPFALTLLCLLCLLSWQAIDFICDPVRRPPSQGDQRCGILLWLLRGWEWISRYRLMILFLAVLIDSTPFCVEVVRRLRPQGTIGIPQFIAFLGVAAGASGTLIRFLADRRGLRWVLLRFALAVLGWGVALAILIALIDYLHFGIPPYGFFLVVPFVAVGLVASALFLVSQHRTVSRVLFSFVIGSLIGLAAASLLLEWYSIQCLYDARIVGERNRPLSGVIDTLKNKRLLVDAAVSQHTSRLLDDLIAQHDDLSAEYAIQWADDYANVILSSWIAAAQDFLTTSVLARSANSTLFQSYVGSGRIEQWGVLTPLRPQYHQHAVRYLHSCAAIDHTPPLDKQRVREILTVAANDRLSLGLTDSVALGQSTQPLSLRPYAKAWMVDKILGALFIAGSGGVDAFDWMPLKSLQERFSATDKVPSDSPAVDPALVKEVLLGFGVNAATLPEAVRSVITADRECIAKKAEAEGTPRISIDESADDSIIDAMNQVVFEGSGDMGYSAIVDALGAAVVRLHDSGASEDFERLRRLLGSMPATPFPKSSEGPCLAGSCNVGDLTRLLALSDRNLAIEASGLLPLCGAAGEAGAFAPTLRRTGPFNPDDHVASVLHHNLAKAAGEGGGTTPADSDGCPSIDTERGPAVEGSRCRAQFILTERAIRPSRKVLKRAINSRATLAELAEPSVPNTHRFCDNLDENEQLMYRVFQYKSRPGATESYGLLPETAVRLVTSQAFDNSQEFAKETARRVALGRYGNLENLGTMVEEVASKTWWVKAVIVLSLLVVLLCFGLFFVDPNMTSFHRFYRDSLAEAFLVAPLKQGGRRVSDNRVKVSQLANYGEQSTAPYPLINTSLNVDSAGFATIRDRRAVPFLFSPKYVGGMIGSAVDGESGRGDQIAARYVPTEEFEKWQPGFTAASAMTVSGGAAAPLMGRYSNWAIRLSMVLANVRLGYWIYLPQRIDDLRHKDGEPVDLPEVLKQEQLAIAKRRSNTQIQCPSYRGQLNGGVFGLAFSGGGIRSAALNFGIGQGLVRHGVWPLIDYLSTVSGGGYVGTAISVFMRTMTAPTEHNPNNGTGDYEAPLSLRRLAGRALCLYREAFHMSASPRFGMGWMNVSDGGHFENIGVYALLQRRCKLIFVGDGEADPLGKLDGLSRLSWLAEIDLGARIIFHPRDLKAIVKGKRSRSRHFAIAKIEYGADPSAGTREVAEQGWMVYMRSSLTGDEDQVIGGYRARSPAFPHESTTDQFFSEEQFEAYRRLGEHILDDVLSELQPTAESDPSGGMTVDTLIDCARRYYEQHQETDDVGN